MSLTALLFSLFLVATGASATDVTLRVVNPPSNPFWHDAYLTVAWTASDVNTVYDFVSIWWVPFAGTYIEYRNVTSTTGSETFHVINARHPFVFRYIRNSTVLAESDEIQPAGSFPMQVHTMFDYSDPTQMRIMWNSNRTTGTETVYYGTDNLGSSQAAAYNSTFTHSELNTKVGLPTIPIRTEMFPDIGSRALRCVWGTCYNDYTACENFVDPGYFHMAVLTGLKPSTVYQFQVGESDGALSKVFTFRTRTPPGSEAVQILYVADAGVGYSRGGFQGGAAHNDGPVDGETEEGGRRVWDAILRDPELAFDQATIMNGDISYARGWPWSWEVFHNETEGIFTRAPVMAAFGNHEFDYGHNPFDLCDGGDSGGECGVVTARRFNLNEDQPWFTTAIGPITFIGLSSEKSPTDQAAWLQQVLPAVDRSVTPWLVVFFHRPIYQSNTYESERMKDAMRDAYGDLFSKYGVDMVLSGHSHYYERMCAISASHCADWGFRDSWDRNYNVVLDPYNDCSYNLSESYYNVDDCRASCMYRDSCTGVVFTNGTCTIIECSLPIPVVGAASGEVWSLTRLQGQPPIYIVDGTAGGVSVPTSTPYSKWTIYKDFVQWGYSRLAANMTSLLWVHYHIDGSIVDTMELSPPPNA